MLENVVRNCCGKLHICEELLWLPEKDKRRGEKLAEIGFWTGN